MIDLIFAFSADKHPDIFQACCPVLLQCHKTVSKLVLLNIVSKITSKQRTNGKQQQHWRMWSYNNLENAHKGVSYWNEASTSQAAGDEQDAKHKTRDSDSAWEMACPGCYACQLEVAYPNLQQLTANRAHLPVWHMLDHMGNMWLQIVNREKLVQYAAKEVERFKIHPGMVGAVKEQHLRMAVRKEARACSLAGGLCCGNARHMLAQNATTQRWTVTEGSAQTSSPFGQLTI